jgi:hypothetical protein
VKFANSEVNSGCVDDFTHNRYRPCVEMDTGFYTWEDVSLRCRVAAVVKGEMRLRMLGMVLFNAETEDKIERHAGPAPFRKYKITVFTKPLLFLHPQLGLPKWKRNMRVRNNHFASETLLE